MWKKFGRTIAILSVVLILVIGVGGVLWTNLYRTVPTSYETPEAHYKYGSIGTEAKQGVPFWVWLMLPRLFPEYLPGSGGYTSLGMTWEPGQEMPVGFTKQTIGYPRVSLNCAACHTATLSSEATDPSKAISAGALNTFDWQNYLHFLHDSANDPRFTSGYILNAISHEHKFSLLEKLLYRFLIIPQTQKRLIEQSEDRDWINSLHDRGEID